MKRIYTKKSEQLKRRKLRKNMTKAEVLLWLEIKNKKLKERFLRQYSVDIYVVDFYCPNKKLAIEVDGATHLLDEDIDYDIKRQREIEKTGIEFLRLTNDEIYEDMFNVIEKIKEKIETL